MGKIIVESADLERVIDILYEDPPEYLDARRFLRTIILPNAKKVEDKNPTTTATIDIKVNGAEKAIEQLTTLANLTASLNKSLGEILDKHEASPILDRHEKEIQRNKQAIVGILAVLSENMYMHSTEKTKAILTEFLD